MDFGQIRPQGLRIAHFLHSPCLRLLRGDVRENPLEIRRLILQVGTELFPHRLPVRSKANAAHRRIQPLLHSVQLPVHGAPPCSVVASWARPSSRPARS